MDANLELKRIKEWAWMRGFANLYHKESRAWWSTKRWWINGLLWTVLVAGWVAVWVFIMPSLYAAAGSTVLTDLGGPLAMGLKMLFTVGGGMIIAIGLIVLCQDLIIGEKQTGLTEWLLANPVQRKAYVLAKLCASLVAILLLLIALPGAAAYAVLSLGTGAPLALQPFLDRDGHPGLAQPVLPDPDVDVGNILRLAVRRPGDTPRDPFDRLVFLRHAQAAPVRQSLAAAAICRGCRWRRAGTGRAAVASTAGDRAVVRGIYLCGADQV